MELIDITQETEDIFFRCMHEEIPANEQAIALRRRWYDERKEKGLRAKVLRRDDGKIAGICQYIPIEHSHLIGENLFAILCIWVHGYEHLIGNQQGKGYGRFILNAIEADAKTSGAKGVAAWGMNFPYWNPVSFYEHMGYKRVEVRDPVVLVWKPFFEDAKPPALIRPTRTPSKGTKKTKVTVFHNDWCSGGCEQCVKTRKAVAGLEDIVDYEEVDTSNRATMMSWGIDDAIFLDDKPFRPYAPPWTSDELRAEIIEVSKQKPYTEKQ